MCWGIDCARDHGSIWRDRLGVDASVGKFYGKISWGSGLPCRDENAWENASDVFMKNPGKTHPDGVDMNA